MSALLFAVRCVFAAFRRCLLSHVCLALRSVRVCVAFQLRVSVAVLLELTELAKPAEMPRLCCNNTGGGPLLSSGCLGNTEALLQRRDLIRNKQYSGTAAVHPLALLCLALSWPSQLRCRVFDVTPTCPARTHRAGHAGREAVSLVEHTNSRSRCLVSVRTHKQSVEMPCLCSNTQTVGRDALSLLEHTNSRSRCLVSVGTHKQPVEKPCLCCNTQTVGREAVSLLEHTLTPLSAKDRGYRAVCLLRRKDMITKLQFALHLISDSTVNDRGCRAVCLRLAEGGMSAITYDMHGHGRSEPTLLQAPARRVLVRRPSHLTDDAELVLDAFVLPAAEASVGKRLPVFAAAHSLGAGILATVESSRPGTFAVCFWPKLFFAFLLSFSSVGQAGTLHATGAASDSPSPGTAQSAWPVFSAARLKRVARLLCRVARLLRCAAASFSAGFSASFSAARPLCPGSKRNRRSVPSVPSVPSACRAWRSTRRRSGAL